MLFRSVSQSRYPKLAALDRVTGRLPIGLLPSNITNISNNFTTSVTITNTIVAGTQYIVVNDSSNLGISAYNNILMNNLEIVGGVSIVNISLNTNLNGGSQTVRFKDSLDNNIITVSDTNLRGIILMWDGTKWVVMSNTVN